MDPREDSPSVRTLEDGQWFTVVDKIGLSSGVRVGGRERTGVVTLGGRGVRSRVVFWRDVLRRVTRSKRVS